MLKKLSLYITGVIMILILSVGCIKAPVAEASFIGNVLEVGEDYLMVVPAAGSKELTSADKIVLRIRENTKLSSAGSTITIKDIVEGSRLEIYYNGEIAESYPAQIYNISRLVFLEDYAFTVEDENFRVMTYIEKLSYKENEEISLYSTIEYIGHKSSITIWSGEPYFHHMIYRNEEEFSGRITLSILKTTELKKGEVYTIPFSKNGGFSEDDADAEFWRSFFSEKELRLPKGEYDFTAVTSFTLDKDQTERVNLKNEFKVEVE